MMTTAERGLAPTERSLGPAIGSQAAGGSRDNGARLRLVFAVAGLGALIAWGIWSHGSADRPSGVSIGADQVSVNGGAAARYDGHGKWTGYTSEWRNRPQILRDAGVTRDR